ncbi:MAG: GntR family transcriptional regulator [Burkholderiaceae bacterium]|nr:GntR family transcriptional regulator [Rhodoferax sp.]MCP5270038.1 GntR family transcriptional regulator [Burkholderiaceae bacterium]
MSAEAVTEDAIYERVLAAVRDQRLPPGTKLVEDRLAQAFGVSRTRIRPVLVRLANEQIVQLTPHRGAAVAQPTAQEAREVFEARQLVEPPLVDRFVATAGEADLEALARNIADEEAARRDGNTAAAIRLAGDFHLLLAQASGQRTLARMLRELISRTSLVLMCHASPGLRDGCDCAAHRGLLAALRARDARRATRLMRLHLRQLEAQLRQTASADDGGPDLLALFAAPSPERAA